MVRIRNLKDFLSGLIFIGFAAVLAFNALLLPLGTASRMGPGYFPLALALILAGLGLTTLINALRIDGDPLPRFEWRGAFLIIAPVVVFAVTIKSLGFIPATVLSLSVTMGMFGIAEVIRNLEDHTTRPKVTEKLKGLWLTVQDFKTIAMPVMRGTVIGSVLGILPGGGAAVSSFASYSIEKGIAKDPSRFGKGTIEAVAGPESANNAGAQTSFIPMLTLGIPANPVMALMIAVLIIQGITPGPQVMTTQPTLVWGLITSMWIGNIMLVILNLPLIGLWTRLLTMPYHFLFPAIVIFCAIGAYNFGNSVFDVYILAIFGGLGYIFAKLDCEAAPFLLGFVLGPMLEDHFRRAMLISRGDLSIFITHPIAAGLLGCAVLALAAMALPKVRRGRREAFKE